VRPRDIDGLLVAGRHISCDATSHSFLREIPQWWLTGQAAGAAAALAAAEKCEPTAVPTAALQALLLRQGGCAAAGGRDGCGGAMTNQAPPPSGEHR